MTHSPRVVRLVVAVCLSLLFVPSAFAASDVVISQVYGGGGNSGATWKNDFVEIFNRGTSAVDITGWTVQYASSTGTSWQKTQLSGTLQPGQYYLVQEAVGTGGTTSLPTPDATGSIAMSATAGKVALVRNNTTLSGGTPDFVSNNIVDFVGYDGANYFEGSGAAPALTNTTAAVRAGNGCTDTDVNSADFSSGTPNPRNTSSPRNTCGGSVPPSGSGSANPSSVSVGQSVLLTVAVTPGTNPASSGITVSADLSSIGDGTGSLHDDGLNGDLAANDGTYSYLYTVPNGVTIGDTTIPVTIKDAQFRTGTASIALTIAPPPPPELAIHDIQGSGSRSPHEGETVSTSGIVTARKSNGFFLQTKDALVDADPNTSEGIFVFTNSAPSSVAQLGNEVAVTGKVQEFVPSSDVNSPSVTEIGNVTSTVLISTGNPLPAPITLTAADTSPTGSIEQLERYEGMRVHVDALIVSGPTGGTVNEANATSTSNGVFYGVMPGIARPFREPGVEVPDPLPTGSPAGVPRFDANPERLRVDTKGQTGSTVLNVTAGALVQNLTGPLDYGFRAYTILQDPTPVPQVSGIISAIPVPAPNADELTIASSNMERFFDTTNDAGISDVALTPTAFANRLNKASLAIRNVMQSPDIIGVEEMENITTLQALAAKVNADTVAAGGSDPQYQAYLFEGADIGGIDVGFLVKSTKVTVLDIHQEAVGTFIQPDGSEALLNDRPSLTMKMKVSRPKADDLTMTVIVNHLRSLNGMDDPVDGPRVRAKRKAQAEFLANIIQSHQDADPNEKIVSVGDYNAFGFNDGYVDSMGTIEGHPTPADQVVLASDDLVNPDLTDIASLLPPDQQYSYNFDGNAQELDHVLVNANALRILTRFAIGRMDSDFPEVYRNDPNRPERLSDHDPAVAYFQLPAQDFDPPVLTLPGNITAEAVGSDGAVVTYSATAFDAATGTVSVNCSVASGSTFALGTTTVNCSATDRHDNTATGSFTVTVRDTTPPGIVITSPAATTYQINQVVNAAYACSDLVGLATCTGDVANGAAISTASAGTHTFAVHATDTAGNPAMSSVSYDVTYGVCVLFDPSKANKAGSTVPVKLQLCDGSGKNYSSSATAVTAIGLTLVSTSASIDVQDSGNANPDGNFRYDASLASYIFNLSSKGLPTGTYLLHFKVQGDPADHTVQFQLR